MDRFWTAHWISRNDQPVPAEIPDYNRVGNTSAETDAFYKTISWKYWDRASIRLRKLFVVKGPVSHATLRGVGLGYYELFINGREVDGEHVLKPIKTTYQDRVAYRTHDVVNVLVPGENVLGAEVAHGWFSPAPKYRDWHMQWQGIPCAIFELVIEYANGTSDLIITDETWRWAKGGVWDSCVYDGEKYDGRVIPDASVWTAPGFDGTAWRPVGLVPAPTRHLFPQRAPDNRMHAVLRPVAPPRRVPMPERLRYEVAGYTFPASPLGTFVYDFGTNIAGRVRVKAGPEGLHAILRHGEEVHDEDGSLDSESKWAADALDEIKLPPHAEYAPRFTYHGFRYCEIEVLSGTLPTEVSAEFIYADVRETGSFTCGDPLLNRIHEAVFRTQKSCLQQGVPVDCPQRAERLGWLGDAHVTSGEAWCNFGMADFYADWLAGIAAQQVPSGDLPHVSPRAGVKGDVCWSSGFVFMLWECYRQTGDKAFLEANFDAARRYVDFLEKSLLDDGTLEPSRYGDWHMLAQNRGDPAWKSGMPFLTSSAYYHRILSVLADAATMLGKDGAETFRRRADAVRTAARAKWYDEATGSWGTGVEGVGANALALFCGLSDSADHSRVLAALAREVTAAGGHLPSGMLGTQAFFAVAGEMDDPMPVWNLLQQRDAPSYAHMLRRKGTLCEQWEAEAGSFNHIMFGSIDVWFHEALAGVVVDFTRTDTPLLYRPHPLAACGHGLASRTLPDGGVFAGGWTYREDGSVEHEVSVPEGRTVRVVLGGEDRGLFGPSQHVFKTTQLRIN